MLANIARMIARIEARDAFESAVHTRGGRSSMPPLPAPDAAGLPAVRRGDATLLDVNVGSQTRTEPGHYQ